MKLKQLTYFYAVKRPNDYSIYYACAIEYKKKKKLLIIIPPDMTIHLACNKDMFEIYKEKFIYVDDMPIKDNEFLNKICDLELENKYPNNTINAWMKLNIKFI